MNSKLISGVTEFLNAESELNEVSINAAHCLHYWAFSSSSTFCPLTPEISRLHFVRASRGIVMGCRGCGNAPGDTTGGGVTPKRRCCGAGVNLVRSWPSPNVVIWENPEMEAALTIKEVRYLLG